MQLTAEDLGRARTLAGEFLSASGPRRVPGTLVGFEYGGLGLSHAEHGEICRLVAEVSPSRQSLLTVHTMVCRAVERWASPSVKDAHLPHLASGESIGAFALTEDEAGSDVRGVSVACEETDDGWQLTGTKRWVTYGLEADYFLLFAAGAEGPLALLVKRTDEGVHVSPSPRTSGLADSRLADVRLEACRVPRDRIVSRPGAALSHVATDALTLGRLSVAFAAWGLARTALNEAVGRSIGRRQFDGPLHDRQLVRGLLADASLAVDATRELCRKAARAMDERSEWMMHDVLTAKLFASRTATSVAATAAQLHGAAGLVEGSPVDVLVRDARVYEVIEGNTQLLQDLVATQVLARYRSGDHDES
ncbi:acyl-CoA dehydrogenase family protein [Oerskovia sp. NPDC060338]|uniref:acyl-CoA dehydrogenase family protein n=1 Tax=Oerskovia sp. NPDC060338 TaxID=3347100 RepID=UPI0036527E96